MSIQIKKAEEKSRILGFAIAQELNVEEINSVAGGYEGGEDPNMGDNGGTQGINDTWSQEGNFKVADDKEK